MFTILCMLFITFNGCATGSAYQDTESVDQVLRWFPEGLYLEISHRKIEKLMNTESFVYHLKITDPDETTIPEALVMSDLPTSMHKHCLTFTRGTIVERRLPEFKTVETELNPQTKRLMPSEKSMIFVYSFDDLESVLKETLNKGKLVVTGKRILGKPVYSFLQEDDAKKSSFAFTTNTNEFLVSDNFDTLSQMVKVGNGLEPGLLDMDDYAEVYELSNDADIWYFSSIRAVGQMQLDLHRENGASRDYLDRIEERIETGRQYLLVERFYGEEIIYRDTTVFGDEDMAKAAMSIVNRSSVSKETPKAMIKHAKRLEKTSTTRLDGRRIIKTLVFDDELLKSEKASYKAMREWKEEKKEEEKNEKKKNQ